MPGLFSDTGTGTVHYQILRTDIPGVIPESIKSVAEVKGASAFLYRFSANFPQRGHWRPKGEYAYVIRGHGSNGDVTTYAGQDSYMPPNSYHPPGKLDQKVWTRLCLHQHQWTS